MKSLLTKMNLLIGFTLGLSCFSFAQNSITVSECNLNGWVKQIIQPGGTIMFKDSHPEPILGKGSLEFSTPQSFVRLRNTLYHHVLLSAISELRFSTFIQNRENDLDAPWVVLQVDTTGDNIADNPLVFQPKFQTGEYVEDSFPDQGQTMLQVWQTWDMLNGAWWNGNGLTPHEGAPVFSLIDYYTQHPTARIVNPGANGTGGIRLQSGGPTGIFAPNFIGNVDDFRIGVEGVTTAYDFEYTIADAGEDKEVILGYGSNCVELQGSASGGVAPYNFSWSPGGSAPNMIVTQVCPEVSTLYTFTVIDENSCVRTDEVTIHVHDVRCGNLLDRVKLCHNGSDICVASQSVQAHLNHGDLLGNCESFAFMNQPNSSGGSMLFAGINFEFKNNAGFDLGKAIGVHVNTFPDELTNSKRNYTQQIECHVYPNPTSGRTMLKYACDVWCDGQAALSDLHGRIIQYFPSPPNVIDLSTWPPGIYILRIQNLFGSNVKQIVKL